MNTWIVIWLVFWVVVMGLPNYLFKKYKITYYENSWQHTVFYFFSLIILGAVYRDYFSQYFIELSLVQILATLGLFFVWVLIPAVYKNDYYTKSERFSYQLPKFFEILFQQLCFLAGLLTFGFAPVGFGLVFFAIHLPVMFLISKKFAYVFIVSSLLGGLIFSYLQSQGINGFLYSLSLHFLFYIAFHLTLSYEPFLGTVPHKR